MDSDKIIRDLATLTEQGRWAAQRFKSLETGQETITEKLDKLSVAHTALYWKVMTFAMVVSGIGGFVATVWIEIAKAK